MRLSERRRLLYAFPANRTLLLLRRDFRAGLPDAERQKFEMNVEPSESDVSTSEDKNPMDCIHVICDFDSGLRAGLLLDRLDLEREVDVGRALVHGRGGENVDVCYQLGYSTWPAYQVQRG